MNSHLIDQLKLILKPIAFIQIILSIFMVISGIIALFNNETEAFIGFFKTVGIVVLISLIILLFSRSKVKKELTIRSGFVIVLMIWVSTCMSGALVYMLTNSIPNHADAVFESVSGFTTTGASILTDIEGLPNSVLFWRALSHWIGGGGIVVLSVAILPLLGIGGSQLMKAETSGVTKEKLTPRIAQTAKYIWLLYLSLNIVAIILLMFGGMNLLDAFSHASSAIATGGFSSKNTSVGYFNSAYIEWVLIFFMYVGSLNFLVLIKAIKGNFKSITLSSELKTFTAIVVLSSFFIAGVLYFTTDSVKDLNGVTLSGVHDFIRTSFFHVVSIISTTGFATADYGLWAPATQVILFLLYFIGGSSGSTSGGIKVVRHIIMFKQAVINVKSLIHPKAIFTMRIDGQPISNRVIITVLGFIVVYMTVLFIGTTIVAFSPNTTVFEAFISMLASLGTVGVGFYSVGPAGNYGYMPGFAKYVLSFGMLIGRLELFTVLILFTPWFWRK